MIGRLSRLSRKATRGHGGRELLELFGLADAAGRDR